MESTALTSGKREKSLHYEIMRLLAIFFVIHTHTEFHGYFLFSSYPDTSLKYWIYLCISIFGAVAVPLFFAVSGALLLNRPEEPLIVTWKKRVVRYGILLVAACFLYYFQANEFDPGQVNPKEFLIILYSYSSGGITWFLYSYLAYLILLPVLQTLAKNLKNIHYIYIFAIVLIYNGIVPVVEYLVFQGNQTMNSAFTVEWIAEKIVVYPLLGYFLEYRLEKQTRRKWLWGLWTANILTMLLTCAMTVYKARVTGVYAEGVSSSFFPAFVLINCAAVYLLVMQLTEKITVSANLRRIICCGGSCTLGIYILHQFIMNLSFSRSMRRSILQTGMNDMLASMLFCLYIFLLCWGITWLLKKIPGVRKLL